MAKTTNRLKALLTAAALGVCCVYAQTATPGGYVLPNADPDADPYDFRMSKTDDGMSVSLTLNRIDRTVTDSTIEITEQENKQIIHLTNAPTGICVISMMVDGEVVDTYKLLKQ